MSRAIDRMQDYAEDLARSVAPARSQVAARRAIGRSSATLPRRYPRVAAATLGFFAIANVAAASVADSAAPGDVLYELDRAYERVLGMVGLDGDNPDERLDEALVLIDRSELGGALELVGEALPDIDVDAIGTSVAAVEGHDELRAAVLELVDGARRISLAARSGTAEDLAAARLEMDTLAAAVAEAARNQSGSDRGGPPQDSPASTAPGQQGQDQASQGQSDQGQGDDGRDNQSPQNQGQGNAGDGTPAATAPAQSGSNNSRGADR